ncbi:MAG: serine/threonine-protein kinase [Mycobacterium sp.]
MPLADGQTFAGYTIGRVLGAGGMGEVYLAQHPRLPRQDALKVLGTSVSDDAEYRQRFNQEAEMVATLRHPNIVTIYDRGDCDGQLWIAMEFVDGTDASRLLTEKYPKGIPPAEVVRIVTAVADALDYAHSRGLLHRDIKPANILLGHPESGDDRIMLVDFGVARWIGQSSDLTGADMTVGTVNYAAPEQLKGEQIDGHADQYSLAATAYHLLTGAAPFANSNPAIVISHHLDTKPPPIGAGHPDLVRLGPVFARALAKDPANRFDRCRDFAMAMQSALGSAGGVMARHRKPEAVPGRKRLLVAAAGAVLVAGVVGAAVAVVRTHVPTQEDSGGGSSSPARPTTPPPPAVSARMDLPVVVIGAECAVLGAAAVDESGAAAYCARVDSQNQETVWSVQPERLRPSAAQPSPTP